MFMQLPSVDTIRLYQKCKTSKATEKDHARLRKMCHEAGLRVEDLADFEIVSAPAYKAGVRVARLHEGDGPIWG
jgi:precorrin-4 methylase